MNRGQRMQPTNPAERSDTSSLQKETQRKTDPYTMHTIPTAEQKRSPAAATIYTLMASKRVARRIACRAYDRRAIVAKERATRVRLEPTYRTGPRKRFTSHIAREAISRVVDSRLAGVSYEGTRAAELASSLSDEIKAAVKRLNFDRYKYVVTTTLGEKHDRDMMVTSRCAWDADTDNSATYEWQNNDMFCCVILFAVYHEWRHHVRCVPRVTSSCSLCTTNDVIMFAVYHEWRHHVRCVPRVTSSCSLWTKSDVIMFAVNQEWRHHVRCVPRVTSSCSLCTTSDVIMFAGYHEWRHHVSWLPRVTSSCSLCTTSDAILFSVYHEWRHPVRSVPWVTPSCSLCTMSDVILFAVYHEWHHSVRCVPRVTSPCSLCTTSDVIMFAVCYEWRHHDSCVPRVTSSCLLWTKSDVIMIAVYHEWRHHDRRVDPLPWMTDCD